MRTEEILPGKTYCGGKHKELRTVVRFGSSEAWVSWAQTKYRLPLGGFMSTQCTGRKSFAKWADSEVPAPSHLGE